MKTLSKMLGVLLVFVNINYAMDAIVACASRGSVPYSLIRGVKVSQFTDVNTRRFIVSILRGVSDTSLDAVTSDAAEVASADDDDLSETGKIRLSSDPIPIVYAMQEDDQDLESEAFLSHSLPRSSLQSPWLTRWRSFLGVPVELVEQAGSGVLTPSSRREFLLEQPFVESEDDEDDFFLSGEFHRVNILTPVVDSKSPQEIPKKEHEVTVTFTCNNLREIVVWGDQLEQYKTIRSLPNVNLIRSQTPITPVNQVVRQSIRAPESRTSEARLREAAINCLVPIQFEINPLTREEVVKIKPRATSPIITGIET